MLLVKLIVVFFALLELTSKFAASIVLKVPSKWKSEINTTYQDFPASSVQTQSERSLLNQVLILDGFLSSEIEMILLQETERAEIISKNIWISKNIKNRLESVITGYENSFSTNSSSREFHRCPVSITSKDVIIHKDVDTTTGEVHALTLVYYLKGSGTLKLSDGTNERDIKIQPGRLIMWSNGNLYHSVTGDSSIRYMLGPLAIGRLNTFTNVGLVSPTLNPSSAPVAYTPPSSALQEPFVSQQSCRRLEWSRRPCLSHHTSL